MSVNRGKQFEEQVRLGLEAVPDTNVVRLIDPQAGFAGVSNVCDFIAYRFPRQFMIECKSCYKNTLSIHTNNPKNKYGAISNTQWEGLLEASKKKGVVAGVLIWYIDHDETIFVPIRILQQLRDEGEKSVNIKDKTKLLGSWIIPGKKRRVLFDYDFTSFLG